MQSTSFLPSTLPCLPTFSRSTNLTKKATARKPDVSIFAASRREEDYRQDRYLGGHLVDLDMIVLRKRIHEMSMAERGHEPPPEWMGWEKRCYASYDSIICETVGFLQSRMMNARPGVVLGVAALLAMSVPTSSALVLFRLAEMAREILAKYHLCA
ncbi:uncharacterized protein LOC104433189 [Eucalyptus grandis]|uniref:uncharacterized protein LOC104433189 n=1 Tax=Eucalyptus grandis TaxID=71139 RepID=UPI00192EC067|nr:uncharacterized protein LOC104433189 [Eucalyptus grandis]